MQNVFIPMLKKAKPIVSDALFAQEMISKTEEDYIKSKKIEEPKKKNVVFPESPSKKTLFIKGGIFAVSVILAPILLIIGFISLSSSSGDSGGMTAAFGIVFTITAIVFGKKGYEEFLDFKSETEKYEKKKAEAEKNKSFNENVFPKLKSDYDEACKNARAELSKIKAEAQEALEKFVMQINEIMGGEYFGIDDYQYIDEIIYLLTTEKASSVMDAVFICEEEKRERIERINAEISESLLKAEERRKTELEEKIKRNREEDEERRKQYIEQQATMQRCVKCKNYPKCSGIPNCGAFVPRR